MADRLLRLPYNVRQRLGAMSDVPDALDRLNKSIQGLTGRTTTAEGTLANLVGRTGTAETDIAAIKTNANTTALQLGLALQAITSLQATSPVFLAGTYTIAQLPDAAANVGKYATVTDLWGDGTRDVVLASSSMVAGVRQSYWKPLRPTSAQSQSVAAADVTLAPLVNGQVQFLTGAIGAGIARKVNLSVARAWPGAMFEIAFDGTLSLSSVLNIAGTGLGSLVGMIVGNRRRFVFDQGAWKQF